MHQFFCHKLRYQVHHRFITSGVHWSRKINESRMSFFLIIYFHWNTMQMLQLQHKYLQAPQVNRIWSLHGNFLAFASTKREHKPSLDVILTLTINLITSIRLHHEAQARRLSGFAVKHFQRELKCIWFLFLQLISMLLHRVSPWITQWVLTIRILTIVFLLINW